jgi:hypothetical protein
LSRRRRKHGKTEERDAEKSRGWSRGLGLFAEALAVLAISYEKETVMMKRRR